MKNSRGNTNRPSRRQFLRTLSLGIAGISLGLQTSCRRNPERPNILLIMADDMGYSDIGCYGGEINTPNIDRLAENGIRFTQFYNAARCCPTRASLLTGLYPHQVDVGYMVYRDRGPGRHGHLNNRCVTIAEVLEEAGYHTMMTGKWHVGHQSKMDWPTNRGFDRFYGIHIHVDSYWKVLEETPVYLDGEVAIAPTETPPNRLHPDEEWYTTDVFTDWALKFLDEAGAEKEPFFLYVAYNAPHWPLEAPEEDINRYRGRYTKGWQEVRRKRFLRMQEMGILNAAWELPEDDVPDWSDLSEKDQRNLDFRRAIYAAQIDRMDQNIGRIVRWLEEQGEMENTLILFWSDNGCSAEPEREMFGYKFAENRIENFREWRKDSRRSSSQGLAWANASNSPFRKYKKWTHEGGIATPLVAHWPSGISRRGEWERQPGHVIDVMATCVDLSGAEYPETFRGRDIIPLEGVSLSHAFPGKSINRGKPLYWEHHGNRAIRDGDWKLVADSPDGEWELYNMVDDRTEVHDLAMEYPDRVEALAARWESWAEKRNVLPWPWEPSYRRFQSEN